MSTICPFAVQEPVGSHGGVMSTMADGGLPYGLLLHVTAGYGDPEGWFANPNDQASSTFFIARDGRLVQYMPAELRSWAQMAGNDLYQSVETEGEPEEPLTAAQVDTLTRLYLWGHLHPQLQWPLQLADAGGQRGLGWHGMDPNYGHPFCPGVLRRGQRAGIIAAVAASVDGGHAVASVSEGSSIVLDAPTAKQITSIVHAELQAAVSVLVGLIVHGEIDGKAGHYGLDQVYRDFRGVEQNVLQAVAGVAADVKAIEVPEAGAAANHVHAVPAVAVQAGVTGPAKV